MLSVTISIIDLAPDWRTTRAHFSLSAAMYFAKASGVPATVWAPWASSDSFTAGSSSACRMAALSLSMIGAGVPAGAKTPSQAATSKPGTPDSAMVGYSGAVGKRCAVVTARPRTLPPFTSGNALGITSIIICTCPPITSAAASAPPR